MKILERIRQELEKRSHKGTPDGFLRLGAGDDAAVVRPRPGSELVLTCDIHVENVHFRTDLLTPRDVGRRVMVSNISDLAAMGASPRAALISMALPTGDPESVLFDMLMGIAEELEDSGGVIAGGNLATTDGPRVVDVSLVGDLEGEPFLRSGARPGDHVVLIGTTGGSAAGLWCLQQIVAGAGDWKPPSSLTQSYARPTHRLEESMHLRQLGGVNALIDTSDGFLADLNHICEASGVGAEIDTEVIPVSPQIEAAAKHARYDPLQWVLGPSDDYALLAAVEPGASDQLLSGMSKGARRVGRFVRGSGVQFLGEGADDIRGWDHFKAP
jgi:thiamine-monophosphate kinase